MRLMSFLDAGNAEQELIDIDHCSGRIAASEIGFYPPCTAIVLRGEVITDEICDIIKAHKNNLFGVISGKVAVVK